MSLQLTFTLMGVPAVEVSVIPLIKKLPNILDLPLISTFVKMAIRAGVRSLAYVQSLLISDVGLDRFSRGSEEHDFEFAGDAERSGNWR